MKKQNHLFGSELKKNQDKKLTGNQILELICFLLLLFGCKVLWAFGKCLNNLTSALTLVIMVDKENQSHKFTYFYFTLAQASATKKSMLIL